MVFASQAAPSSTSACPSSPICARWSTRWKTSRTKWLELVKEEGRDPGAVRLSIRLYLDPEGKMPAAKSVAGSREQMVDTIGRWEEIGVSHILFDPVASGGNDGRAALMERFMTDVAPHA